MRTAKPNDWNTERLPERRVTIALDRVFSEEDAEQIRRGVVPEQMEDKWFVYWQDDTLFFHRSWTGYCVYIVRFVAEGDTWRMVQADVNRDPEQYKETSDEQDARMLSYLVDVLLLHRDATFPSGDASPDTSALMTWSQVGRAMHGEHPGDEETSE